MSCLDSRNRSTNYLLWSLCVSWLFSSFALFPLLFISKGELCCHKSQVVVCESLSKIWSCTSRRTALHLSDVEIDLLLTPAYVNSACTVTWPPATFLSPTNTVHDEDRRLWSGSRHQIQRLLQETYAGNYCAVCANCLPRELWNSKRSCHANAVNRVSHCSSYAQDGFDLWHSCPCHFQRRLFQERTHSCRENVSFVNRLHMPQAAHRSGVLDFMANMCKFNRIGMWSPLNMTATSWIFVGGKIIATCCFT